MTPLKKPQLPIYFCTLDMDIPDRQAIYDNIIAQHRKANYEKSNNFLLTEPSDGFLTRLYKEFFQTAETLFGPLELLPKSTSRCWAYVTNKNDYLPGIHNHQRTCTINAVYYFHVPPSSNYRDSTLSFYDDAHNEILCYKPRNGDLVIFPDYLDHEPNQCMSEDYRISINMEIVCKEVWKSRFRPPY